MNFGRREPAQGMSNLLIRNVENLVQGLSPDHFCRHARCRDGPSATDREKGSLRHPMIYDSDKEAHRIPAHRIDCLPHAVGILHLAHIPRMREMVHDNRIIETCGFTHDETLPRDEVILD